MSFWKRKRQSSEQASSADDTGQVQKARKGVKRSPPLAMEVKILALEALDSGLSAIEVRELVGVGSGTIHKWRKGTVNLSEIGPLKANRETRKCPISRHLQRFPGLQKRENRSS